MGQRLAKETIQKERQKKKLKSELNSVKMQMNKIRCNVKI